MWAFPAENCQGSGAIIWVLMAKPSLGDKNRGNPSGMVEPMVTINIEIMCHPSPLHWHQPSHFWENPCCAPRGVLPAIPRAILAQNKVPNAPKEAQTCVQPTCRVFMQGEQPHKSCDFIQIGLLKSLPELRKASYHVWRI